MGNKFLYAFLKDGTFRVLCIFSVIGMISCLVLFRMYLGQGLALKDIQDKQAMIVQIPALQDKIKSSLQKKGAIIDNLVLSGIILDKAQPMAVINDTLVKIGDHIEGKRVVSISGNKVKVCNIKASDKCTVLLLEQ
jgi:hypothetical protein